MAASCCAPTPLLLPPPTGETSLASQLSSNWIWRHLQDVGSHLPDYVTTSVTPTSAGVHEGGVGHISEPGLGGGDPNTVDCVQMNADVTPFHKRCVRPDWEKLVKKKPGGLIQKKLLEKLFICFDTQINRRSQQFQSKLHHFHITSVLTDQNSISNLKISFIKCSILCKTLFELFQCCCFKGGALIVEDLALKVQTWS